MEPFSILKFLDFSIPALAKCVSVVLKGLIVITIIGGFIWGVYVVLVKPHTNPTPTTDQRAETIINYNVTPKQTFGCSNWAITKPDKRKEPSGNPNSDISGGSVGLQKDGELRVSN